MMNPKLFAHIMNDAHLVGTRTLEGMVFNETINSLLQYVRACETEQFKSSSESIQDNIAPLLKVLQCLKQNSSNLNQLGSDVYGFTAIEVEKQETFSKSIKKIRNQIDALKVRSQDQPNSVLMPGGWSNKDGGHALVYEFQQDENGDLVFIVHNSGAGLNFHQKMPDPYKKRFCPIKAYRIPKEELNDDKLNWFIGELMKPRLTLRNEKNYSAKRLYTEVFTKIAYLNGKLVDSFQYTNQDNFTAGQHSGTCTEKALHQMVEHALPNKKTYKQFIYEYKRYALEKYSEQVITDNSIDDPGVRNQISLAIENMARLLLKADYFDEDTRKREAKYLLDKSKIFTRTPLVAKLPFNEENVTQALNNLISDSEKLTKVNIKYPEAVALPDLSEENEGEKGTKIKIRDTIEFNFKTDDLKSELDIFYQEVEKLAKMDPLAAANSIENFLLNYAIPDLPEPSFEETIDKLGALNELYIKIYRTINEDKITTKFITAQLSFIGIVSTVAALSLKVEDNIHFLDIVRTAGMNILQNEQNNPYLASQDYISDARMFQMTKLLTSEISTLNYNSSPGYFEAHAKNKYYYDGILKRNNLKDTLDLFYETYCDIVHLKKEDKVCDKGRGDIRALYLIQQYFEKNEEGKKVFIEQLTKHNQYDESQKMQLEENLRTATKEILFQNKLDTYVGNAYVAISHNIDKQLKIPSVNLIQIKDRGYSGDAIASRTIEAFGHGNKLSDPDTISWMKDSVIKLILEKYTINPNYIQVADFIPKKNRQLNDIKWIREFLQLRTSDLQLRASLEFFTQNLHHLQDLDKQLYLEVNIFQPPFLINALDEDPDTIEKLHQFIELGIQSFSKNGKPELPAMFFMTLSIKIAFYSRAYFLEKKMNLSPGTIEYSKADKALNKISEDLKCSLENINRLLGLVDNLDGMEQDLSFQKILIVSDLLAQSESIEEKKLLCKQLLSSLLAFRYYDKEIDKPFQNQFNKESIENAFRVLQFNLEAINQIEGYSFEFLLATVINALVDINPSFQDKINENLLTYEVDFPYVKVLEKQYNVKRELCCVDISTGRVSRPGLDRAWLPDAVLNTVLFKRIVGDADLKVLANRDNTYFEFEHKGTNYRIIKKDEKYSIQRKYNILNRGDQWYQAQDIQDIENLQTILKEGNNIAWIKINDKANKESQQENFLITNGRTGEPTYSYDVNSKALIKLNAQQNDTGLRVLNQTSFLHQLVSHFEDPQFVVGLEGKEGYQIELPRYNLNLQVNKSRNNDEWEISLDSTDFTLDLSQKSEIILGLKSPLVFESSGVKKVILPIQQFVIEADLQKGPEINKESNFLYSRGENRPTLIDPAHRFDKKANRSGRQDNIRPVFDDPSNRFIKKKSIPQRPDAIITDPYEKYNGERTEYYNLTQDISDHLRQDYFFDKLNPAKVSFQQYQGTAQYAEYGFDNNELMPMNMEGGLYLAYAYLCSNLPDKAYEILECCVKQFGEISGTQNEFDYLSWIIFSTPAKLKNSETKATIETPEYLAVKLKAMSLLASFKRDNPGYKVEIKHQNDDTRDSVYKNMSDKSREQFYDNAEENIYALYHQYHHTKSNVPREYQLSDHDKLNLLRSIYSGKKRKAEGPIGLAWRKLEAENLHTELIGLESKAKRFQGEIPAKLIDDIERVKKRIQKEKPILATRSIIKESQIRVKVPKKMRWHFDPLSVKDIKKLNIKTSGNVNVKSLLKFPINEEKFIRNFPLICDSILLGKFTFEEEQELRAFTEQTIKAYYSAKAINSNIRDLSYVLSTFIDKREIISSYPPNVENEKESKRDIRIERDRYKKCTEVHDLDEWMSHTLEILSRIPDTSIEIVIEAFDDLEEGQDDNEKALTTTRALSEEIEAKYKAPKHIMLKNFTSKEYAGQVLFANSDPDIDKFYNVTSNLEQAHSEVMDDLVTQFERCESIVDIDDRLSKETEIDDIAGMKIVELEKNKLELAVNLLGKSDTRDIIFNRAKSAKVDLENKCLLRMDDILRFANQKFDIDPTTASEVDLQLALMGRKRNRLNKQDLFRLYVGNDLLQTVKATGLTQNESEKLHDKITKYLVLSIQKQGCERLCRSLEDPLIHKINCDASSSSEVQETLAKVGQLIFEKNIIDSQASPALTLFQYDQDILVRKVQKDYIETLLKQNSKTDSYDNVIIQLIMGGGKSKVLLPILALKKSTGENLSIIEVPEALYKTNLADLNQVSLRLFGQHAFGLHFDRQTPSNSENLKNLYRQLKYVITSRGYLVTTRESMASLDLKYHELLSNPPPTESDREEWKRQIKWLDRIINLRKSKGDVLVDEVDSSLSIREQINYTVGERVPVPELHIESVLALYQFLDKIPYSDTTVLDLVTKRDPLSTIMILDVLNLLANELVSNSSSPLFPYLPDKLTQSDQEHIVDYLLNKRKTIPLCLQAIEDEHGKFTYKHLKGQISHLLPHTLTLKLYENYGPSENPEKSLLEKMITIPYSGNNEPEENSKDTNHLKTLNLTIQNNFINGISIEVIGVLFSDWMANAKAELLENPNLNTIDNTATGLAINAVLYKSGHRQHISRMNLDDQGAMNDLYEKLKHDHEFIFFTLQQQILPIIKIDSKMITHNAINHVDMYRSYQGVTGTPSNWRTMHQSLNFNASLSLGTDGITTARLKAKKISVKAVDYQNPSQFLNEALTKISELDTLRAIIDVGATFRGIKNIDVAIELAQFFKDYNQKHEIESAIPIKYIKYFDKNEAGMDELYAMAVGTPNRTIFSLKGKTASEIDKLLGSTPNECFTYYDQKHCRGADIRQATNAKALITVDQATLKDDFYQGIMRMRGFSGSQSVKVIVSNETKKAIASVNPELNIDAIIQLTENNQKSKLLQDHFSAALEKMRNLIVSDLKKIIQRVDSGNSDEKNRLEMLFEPMLSQSLSDQFIDSYGVIETYEDTIEIFKQYSQSLLMDWLTLVNTANIQFSENERVRMMDDLNKLQINELRNCNKQYLHSSQPSPDQTTQSQQEMRSNKQQEQNQQQHLDVDESLYEPHYKSAGCWRWTEKVTFEEFLSSDFNALFDTPFLDCHHRPTKEQLTYPMPDLPISTFDKGIRRSNNFYFTTERWRDQYAPCQKQIHAVMMHQTPDGLKAIILTYPEAAYIKAQLKKSPPQPPNYIWLTNTQGSLLSGKYGKKPPSEILNSSYERIMQQLQFYNGDLLPLLRQDLSGSWLMEDFDKKMLYFEYKLLPYRMTDKHKFTTLKLKMQALQDAYESVVVDSSAANKVNISWQKKYPALSSDNINSLKKFRAFCCSLASGDISEELIEHNLKYFNPFYFMILQNHGNVRQFENYIKLIDSSTLKERLESQFLQTSTNHNYDAIVASLESDAYSNNPEKRSIYLEALGEAFKDSKFTEGLYTHASQDTMTTLMELITQDDKDNLLQSLSSKQITDIFTKDIEIIKLFFDNLEHGRFHQEIAMLGSRQIPVEGSEWETIDSFDYILKDKDKYDYLLKHADKQYLIKLFGGSGRGAITTELFGNCGNGSQDNESIRRMNSVLEILESNIPDELQHVLWSTAINMSLTGCPAGQFNPIAYLSEKLPNGSFINAIKRTPDDFLYKVRINCDIELMSKKSLSKLKPKSIVQGYLYLSKDGQYKAYNPLDPSKPFEGSLFDPNQNNELNENLKTFKVDKPIDPIIASEVLKITFNRGHTPSPDMLLNCFWEEFVKIPSEKDKYKLITEDIRVSRGWDCKTLLVILKEMQEKPHFYYELLAFQLKNELIEAVKTNNWSMASKLREYEEAMNESPKYFMPLSEIDFESDDGTKTLLASFIQEGRFDKEFIGKFNEYVAKEDVSKKILHGFERQKSIKSQDELKEDDLSKSEVEKKSFK